MNRSRSSHKPSAARRQVDAGDPTLEPKYARIPRCGLVVLESRHAPGWATPSWFDEDFNKFVLVVSGQGRLRLPDRLLLLGKNTLFHAVAHTPHLWEDLPGEPVVNYVIHYRPHVLTSGVVRGLSTPAMIHWNLGGPSFPIGQSVRAEFQEMLFEQITRREGWEALLPSLLVRLAVRVLRLRLRRGLEESPVTIGGQQSLQRVASYVTRLESGFYQQQTLDGAALTAGVSRRRFTTLFREVTGATWQKHIESLRLKHAQRLLSTTQTYVLAVAFECGFDSESNFHRVFKEAFGCTPAAFRERAKRRSG